MTKYVVNVWRTLAQTVEIEAESEDEAQEKAEAQSCDGTMKWSLDQFTDEVETEVIGTVNADGERVYDN